MTRYSAGLRFAAAAESPWRSLRAGAREESRLGTDYEPDLMSLRRIAKATSLALLVAVLAHAADFGSSHEPGGPQGAALLHALWATLALLGFSTMLSGALGRRIRPGTTQGADGAGLAVSVLGLTLGGFAAFCALESLEGHAPDVEPALVLYLAAAAAFVVLGSRLAGRWLTELGGGFAAWAEPTGALRGRGIARLRLRQPFVADRARARGARRGRAPPFAER